MAPTSSFWCVHHSRVVPVCEFCAATTKNPHVFLLLASEPRPRRFSTRVRRG